MTAIAVEIALPSTQEVLERGEQVVRCAVCVVKNGLPPVWCPITFAACPYHTKSLHQLRDANQDAHIPAPRESNDARIAATGGR